MHPYAILQKSQNIFAEPPNPSNPLKKHRLIIHDLLEDIALVGITSTLRDYKLAWLINQITGLKLAQAATLSEEIFGQDSPKGVVCFSSKTAHCTIGLVKNKLLSREGDPVSYLEPYLRQFDFFFFTQDFTQAFHHEEFCDSLRTLKQITYVAYMHKKKWLRKQTDLLEVMRCL